MKITLRKKDSVTSIVLFLFNIHGQYKDNYSIELSNLIKFIKYFNKSEGSIRMSLSRMVKSNILINKKINNETVYKLTKEGLENIKIWNRNLAKFFKRYELRHSEWNKNWNLIILINFNKSNIENQFIIDEFKETGIKELDNNIWISPYSIPDKLIEKINKNNYKYLQTTGDLTTNLDSDYLLNNIFKINQIRKKYIQFINNSQILEEKIKKLKGGDLLPLLFQLGWQFYDIVTSDPALPSELLKDWEGDIAVKKMNQLRSKLYNEIINYFQKVNS
jgi:phenylacetic acid degradation operon negative regulatory protein